MKKIAVIALTLSLCAGLLTACRGNNSAGSNMPSDNGSNNGSQVSPSDNRSGMPGSGQGNGIMGG